VVGSIGLSYAEIIVMYERTGELLVYAQEALGETASFMVGWMV
jgi:amino acid transporter